MHRARRARIEQVAMLDRAHPRPDRALDRARRIGVRHHVFAGVLGFLADRAHLLDRVLRALDRVVGAHHAAARHDLEVVRAVPQLLARGAAHLRHAVANRAKEPEACAGAEHRFRAARPRIRVPAGLRERPAGNEKPRPGEEPALDRFLQAEVGARGVAHRGEAAQQHAFQNILGQRRDERGRLGREADDVMRGRSHMHMAVDQPGKQGLALEVEAPEIRRFDVLEGDVRNPLALDEDGCAATQDSLAAIEQGRVAKRDAVHLRAGGTWKKTSSPFTMPSS
jgi:hypothetical protein